MKDRFELLKFFAVLITIVTLLVVTTSQTPVQKVQEREYKFSVPESKVQSFWMLLVGDENITVKQYKETVPFIQRQIEEQANAFRLQDSIAASKAPKKDSLKIKK